MDLVFVLDTSGSMSSYWSDVKTFIKGVMAQFSAGISNGDVKFALVTFDYLSNTPIKWNLDDPVTNSLSQMNSTVDAVTTGGYRYPHYALNLVRTSVFGQSGDRNEARNVVIYISDGYEPTTKLNVEVPVLKKVAR